jgi:hypothetical protein
MPSCHICGVQLPRGGGIRREIRIGTSTGGFSNRAPLFWSEIIWAAVGSMISGRARRMRTRSYFSLRTICQSCSAHIDRQNKMELKILVGAMVVVAIGVVFLIALSK